MLAFGFPGRLSRQEKLFSLTLNCSFRTCQIYQKHNIIAAKRFRCNISLFLGRLRQVTSRLKNARSYFRTLHFLLKVLFLNIVDIIVAYQGERRVTRPA